MATKLQEMKLYIKKDLSAYDHIDSWITYSYRTHQTNDQYQHERREERSSTLTNCQSLTQNFYIKLLQIWFESYV